MRLSSDVRSIRSARVASDSRASRAIGLWFVLRQVSGSSSRNSSITSGFQLHQTLRPSALSLSRPVTTMTPPRPSFPADVSPQPPALGSQSAG